MNAPRRLAALALVAALAAGAPAAAHAAGASGRLLDARGHPVAGATLVFDNDPAGSLSSMMFPQRLQGAGPEAMTLAAARTDARRFHVAIHRARTCWWWCTAAAR